MKSSNQVGRQAHRAAVALAVAWFGGAFFASAQTNTNTPAATNETRTVTEFKPLQPGEYNNWLDFSVGNFFVSGNDAQFQQRHQMPAGVFGGIEAFHWETAVQKKGLFTIDGRGIFDNHDYDLSLSLSHPDIGYVRAGYREFRTWYDGSGGFFPPNGQWVNLYNDEMSVPRKEAFIEAGLTLPNAPVVTFRFSHEIRDGQKGSTSWGDTALTGGVGTRATVPSFYDIDEHRDLVELDLKPTIGKTEFGVGGRLDFLMQNDS